MLSVNQNLWNALEHFPPVIHIRGRYYLDSGAWENFKAGMAQPDTAPGVLTDSADRRLVRLSTAAREMGIAYKTLLRWIHSLASA